MQTSFAWVCLTDQSFWTDRILVIQLLQSYVLMICIRQVRTAINKRKPITCSQIDSQIPRVCNVFFPFFLCFSFPFRTMPRSILHIARRKKKSAPLFELWTTSKQPNQAQHRLIQLNEMHVSVILWWNR